MKDVMLDIETFGTGNNAAIASIGACFFDADAEAMTEDAFGGTFHEFVNMGQTSPEMLGDLHIGTVMWWMSQSDEARTRLLHGMGESDKTLGAVLNSFAIWLAAEATAQGVETHRLRLWSNGPTFDETIVRAAFDRYEMKLPLSFRGSRCCRTMRDLANDFGWDWREQGKNNASHDALADALYQSRGVILQRMHIRSLSRRLTYQAILDAEG